MDTHSFWANCVKERWYVLVTRKCFSVSITNGSFKEKNTHFITHKDFNVEPFQPTAMRSEVSKLFFTFIPNRNYLIPQIFFSS